METYHLVNLILSAFRWLMSVSSLMVVSAGVSPGAGARNRRRADKHLGSAPVPALYAAAPAPSTPEPVDLHNKVEIHKYWSINAFVSMID